MVVQQNTKFSPNYRGKIGAHQHFNNLFPARQPVNGIVRAAKIANRRSTCAAPTHRLYVYFDYYSKSFDFTLIDITAKFNRTLF